MAKRFSDSEKWKKPFIRSLQAPYKLLWLYILDECDHAGIWEVDFEVAEIKLGEKLDRKIAENLFIEKIIVIDNKWFISDFIDFQYGKLSSTNRVHQSVIEILQKHNLLNEDNSINKGHTSPLQRVKDKDMVKVKDTDKEKGEKSEIKKMVQIILPWPTESFKAAWDRWKEYKKKEFKFQYKSEISEQAALNDLEKMSKKSEATAIELIEKAITKTWKGIYLTTENNGGQRNKSNGNHRAVATPPETKGFGSFGD